MVKRRDLLLASVALPALAADEMTELTEAKNKRKRRLRDRKRAQRRERKRRRRDRKRARRQANQNKPLQDLHGMNVLLFMTDQERPTMHFPAGWEEQNLPGLQRLKRHGLTFENTFCNTCMCSPSRATLLTGYFPAQHGVTDTIEYFIPDLNPLPLDLPNLATVMKAASYRVPFKGKWHLSYAQAGGEDWQPSDVNQYGYERWNPPDAGANQDLDQFGGGDANNDGRIMNDDGNVQAGEEGVLAYLRSKAAQQQPFFLTVNLVNPHDVLSYTGTPGLTWEDGGYTPDVLAGNIDLPATVDEDLSTKPVVQQLLPPLFDQGLGALPGPAEKRNYLNFYGNLIKQSDAYLVQILDVLEEKNLLDNTLIIRTSDHGEMGMAHGGLRQKNFNFYEETLRVPLVFSNPRLFPNPKTSNALVSHVDFLPTMASLFNAPQQARAKWQGRDYSKLVLGTSSDAVQDYIVFTYDDVGAGQQAGPIFPPAIPDRIVSIRERRYKLAKYYDGTLPDQWEMYDLQEDRFERRNIAHPDYPRTPRQERELVRLKQRLANVEQHRLEPL